MNDNDPRIEDDPGFTRYCLLSALRDCIAQDGFDATAKLLAAELMQAGYQPHTVVDTVRAYERGAVQ